MRVARAACLLVLLFIVVAISVHAQAVDAKKVLASTFEKGPILTVTQAETCPGASCRTYFHLQGDDKVPIICVQPFYLPADCDLFETNQCISVLGFPIAEGGQHYVVAIDVLPCPE